MLRALVLALDHDAGRQVRDADRRVGLVDVLAAGPGRAEGVDAQLGRIERDVLDLVEFRQDRHGARRRVDAALRLGGRHALHAVRARLELEARIGAAADHAADDFLVAAVLAGALAQHLDLPALPLGKAGVHAEQVAREDRRLVAAGAGADLEEDVGVVALVLRDQELREFEALGLDACVEVVQLVLGQRAHVGIGAGRHLCRRRTFGLQSAELPESRSHRLEARVFHRQVAERALLADHLRIGEQRTHFLEPLGGLLEATPDGVLHQSWSSR